MKGRIAWLRYQERTLLAEPDEPAEEVPEIVVAQMSPHGLPAGVVTGLKRPRRTTRQRIPGHTTGVEHSGKDLGAKKKRKGRYSPQPPFEVETNCEGIQAFLILLPPRITLISQNQKRGERARLGTLFGLTCRLMPRPADSAGPSMGSASLPLLPSPNATAGHDGNNR